jgi:hypothetical protein
VYLLLRVVWGDVMVVDRAAVVVVDSGVVEAVRVMRLSVRTEPGVEVPGVLRMKPGEALPGVIELVTYGFLGCCCRVCGERCDVVVLPVREDAGEAPLCRSVISLFCLVALTVVMVAI